MQDFSNLLVRLNPTTASSGLSASVFEYSVLSTFQSPINRRCIESSPCPTLFLWSSVTLGCMSQYEGKDLCCLRIIWTFKVQSCNAGHFLPLNLCIFTLCLKKMCFSTAGPQVNWPTTESPHGQSIPASDTYVFWCAEGEMPWMDISSRVLTFHTDSYSLVSFVHHADALVITIATDVIISQMKCCAVSVARAIFSFIPDWCCLEWIRPISVIRWEARGLGIDWGKSWVFFANWETHGLFGCVWNCSVKCYKLPSFLIWVFMLYILYI